MAKKTQNNSEEQQDFYDFLNQVPKEERDMLESFGVSSFEDLLVLSVMLGIDPDKMQKFSEEHGDDVLPSIEEVMFDDNDPAGEFFRTFKSMTETEIEDTDDDSPFALPDRIMFDDEPANAYHLRIKLKSAPLPIWREVEVPSNISLAFFAFVVLDAMGWENEHLHQFMNKDTIYKNSVCAKHDQKMFGDFMSGRRTLVSDDYSLSTIFKGKGDRISFEYDFGDSWNHDIWLKGVRKYGDDEKPTLKILKGKGACPPEDCGGVGGYAYLLELHEKKRKTAEDKERLQWYDIDRYYDPEELDIDRIEENLNDLWSDATS